MRDTTKFDEKTSQSYLLLYTMPKKSWPTMIIHIIIFSRTGIRYKKKKNILDYVNYQGFNRPTNYKFIKYIFKDQRNLH